MKKDNHKKLAKLKVKKFQKNGIKFSVKELLEENDLLKVVVEAEKDGKKIEVNNPLYYKNPPLKVPNGKKIKVEYEGMEHEIDEFEENHEKALKEIIYQTVWQH